MKEIGCRGDVTKEGTQFVEAYYGIKLPQDYKDFLLQYGGGYFAYTIVYSLDENSDFCLRNKVRPKFLEKYNFLPVVDFETGDVAGFEIIDGKCQNTISIYNHENAEMIDLEDNLYGVLAEYGISVSGR